MAPGSAVHRAGAGWLVWLGLLAGVTWGLHALRDDLDEAQKALAYLLLVLGGSATSGRAVGLALSVLGFLCFNYFLLPPYYTLGLADPLHWVVLVAFLLTSVVATQLLDRTQRAAAEARRRAEEVDHLSKLGAESLAAARAEDAVGALARALRATLGISSCDVFLFEPRTGGFRRLARAATLGPEESSAGAAALGPTAVAGDEPLAGNQAADSLFELVLHEPVAAVHRGDGAFRIVPLPVDGSIEAAVGEPDARTVIIPLRVRERTVGVLRLEDRGGIRLDAARCRFATALSAYAALAVERVRLAAEAEHAEALREADRLKDALLASVSHDLRTPLTTIKALAQELRREGDERAAVIEEEADRLNRFVSDLLDLSRLEGGPLPLSIELVAAEDLLGAALQRVSGTPRGREIRAALPKGELLVGRFDFAHSLRALVNLLENALKYSPPGASVEVAVLREGDRLVFQVKDRGPGVPTEEREHIFEPFVRTNLATGSAGGAGLGLPIARRLARAQGGEVTYEPREAGGSIFQLQLPAADLAETMLSL